MTVKRWVLGAIAAACCFGMYEGDAQAQSVVVEGQVQYGAPNYGQPPPGYGQYGQQAYGQPYQQPYQPYAPTYVQPQRRVQYVDRETSIKGLWIPGIVVFGVSYVLTFSLASLSYSSDYANFAWIPLVGPWLMLSASELNDEEIGGALLSGVAQLAGLTMFVLGLVLKQSERVAVYTLDRNDPRSPSLALDVAPAPDGAMVGLRLSHF